LSFAYLLFSSEILALSACVLVLPLDAWKYVRTLGIHFTELLREIQHTWQKTGSEFSLRSQFHTFDPLFKSNVGLQENVEQVKKDMGVMDATEKESAERNNFSELL